MAFDVTALGIDEGRLPTGWMLRRLDFLASLNPEQVSSAYPHSDIAYLDIANVSSGIYGDPLSLSLADAPSRAKRVVRDRDTILSTVRPGNRAYAFVRSAPDNLVASTGFAVLRAKPDADPRFVYYLATSNPIIDYLASIAEEKTAYPSVNPDDIAECTVPVPPRDEQRAIAHILGTLDDKIELNRRMSETLEAMARALFKSWFVDFLPVRAKMAAKENNPSLLLPQAEPGTWYVYAIECNDGSLYVGHTENLRQRWLQHVDGKGANWTKSHPPVRVPYWERQPSREAAVEREKWLKTGFGRKWLKKEIAARTQTGDPVRQKSQRQDAKAQRREGERHAAPASSRPGGLAFPQHILDLFPARLVDSELGEIPEGWRALPFADTVEIIGGGTPKTSVDEYWNGNIPWYSVVDAPSGVWVTQTQKYITQVGLDRCSTKLLPVGTTIISARGTVGRLALTGVPMTMNQSCYGLRAKIGAKGYFNYFATLGIVGELQRRAHGSVFDTITRESLSSVQVVAPPPEVVDYFEESCGPWLEHMLTSVWQSRTLAALRDALLPKLISGELRLPAALRERAAQAGVKDAERFIGGVL